LPRTTITFRLSGTSQQQDLLHEFALHDGVVARQTDIDGQTLLTVETSGAHPSVWDIRSTVGLFDDHAVEVSVLGDEQPS
jgi:hypothetical protein